jgi:ABC-type nitrate/sulfonate/bicarbonate transport system substrate-binding protein
VRAAGSGELRDGLLSGELDVVHATFDDLIAWRDGSGVDVVAWLGGSSGPLALAANPSISAVAGLRGQPIGVDDPHSGFASILRRRLRQGGLRDDEVELVPIGATRLRIEALRAERIAATMLSLPFSLQAREWGATILDDGRLDPPAAGAISRRAWLAANAGLADDYYRAVLTALTSLMTPDSADDPVKVVAHVLGVEEHHARELCSILFGTPPVWPPSAVPDRSGFDVAWQLRAEVGDPPKAPPGDYLMDVVYSRVLGKTAG